MKSLPWMICCMIDSDFNGNVYLTYLMLISVIIWICLSAYFFLRMSPLLFMKQSRDTCSVPLPIPCNIRSGFNVTPRKQFCSERLLVTCVFVKTFQLRATSQKHVWLYSRAQRTCRFATFDKSTVCRFELLLHQSRHVDGDANSSYAVDVRDYGYAIYKYSV